MLGGDDDSGDHHQERHDLAGDGRGAVAHVHLKPQDAEADRDHRIGGGDDRLDRRQERALLEGVLVEQVADRAGHGEDVDGPVAEQLGRPVELGRDELDRERGDPVADAAGQRRRERLEGPVP
jgi:hypothetical protein